MQIKHAFTSPITDDENANEIGPDEWNDVHLFDGAVGPITTSYAELSSDQGSVSSDTATDVTGCSITLAAGTWLIWAQLSCSPGSGYSYAWIATGSSGTGTPFAQAEDNSGNVAGRITVQIQPVIITPSSSTSYHLRGQLGGGGSFNANPNSLGKSTFITAMRLDQASIGTPTSCLAQRTSTQSVSINPTTIIFDAADIYDPDNWHDPSSNNTRLTCPTGKGGRVFIATASAEYGAASIYYLRILKNGSEIVGQDACNNNYVMTISCPVYLVDDDYIELLITNVTGNNIIQTDVPTTFGIMG